MRIHSNLNNDENWLYCLWPAPSKQQKLSMEGITIVLPVNQCNIYIHVYTHLMIMSLRLVGVTATTIGYHANSCKWFLQEGEVYNCLWNSLKCAISSGPLRVIILKSSADLSAKVCWTSILTEWSFTSSFLSNKIAIEVLLISQ